VLGADGDGDGYVFNKYTVMQIPLAIAMFMNHNNYITAGART
jgi:hypothetical protein